jgi:hypothetical protein
LEDTDSSASLSENTSSLSLLAESLFWFGAVVPASTDAGAVLEPSSDFFTAVSIFDLVETVPS